MSGVLDKVTAFVVRPSAAGYDLLLFRHHAGSIQVPAGTVEPDEMPLTDERRVLQTTTTVYAPDQAELRLGPIAARHLGALRAPG